MHTIEIDFEVFKALTMKRSSEQVTYNDVLRDLLNLPPSKTENVPVVRNAEGEGWRSKGVLFPNGTEFRARYKGETYTAKVEGGALVLNGKSHYSSSRAARSVTGKSVNGWFFWQARRPGDSDWRVIDSFRP